MKKTKSKKRTLLGASETRRLLDRFFGNELDPDEHDKIFEHVDPVAARSYLIDRLLEGGMGAEERLSFPLFFELLGIGDARERLFAILRDASAGIAIRTTASNILITEDEKASFLFSLPPDEREAILKQHIADQIVDALCHPEMRGVLARLLLQTDPEQMDMFSMIDDLRHSLGVPATPLYSEVLQARTTPEELRRRLLQAVADDGSIGALEFLERLSEKRGWRERLRDPLMRVRTRIAERPTVSGRAYLSPWENGAWFAGVDFDTGGARISAGLQIEDGSVVDGYAGAGLGSTTALALRDAPLAEMTPEEVFAATEAAIRNASVQSLDAETRAAIEIIQRVSHAAPRELPRPASSLDGRAVEALFRRREYEGWLFTPEQLTAAGVEPPDQIPPTERWKEEGIRKLASTDSRQQLSHGAEYMARWHAARGETKEAEMLARLAIDFRRKFEQSAVVRRLLERSAEELAVLDEEECGEPYSLTDLDDDDLFDEDDQAAAFENFDRVLPILLPLVDAQRRRRGGVPEVRATFDRLTAAGIPKDQARTLIALAMHCEMRYMMERKVHLDPDLYARLLDTLPDLDAMLRVIEDAPVRAPAAPLHFERVEGSEWCIVNDVSEAADNAFEAGMDALQEGDLKAAARHYRRAVKLAPDHIDALHHIAIVVDRKRPGQALGLWEHACERVMKILPDELRSGSGHLHWGWIENRPFLRACQGLVIARIEAGLYATALELAERILRWNPDDNQGVRALAVRAAFASGRPEAVMDICNRYRGDILVDLTYGRVLALWLLGREKQARKAAEQATTERPLVAKELLAATHEAPQMSPYGVTVGGADEAFLYWEWFGEFWQSVPGALDLLREARPKRRGSR